MLELIIVLSAVLRKFSDLAVVSALLIVNALLSFAARFGRNSLELAVCIS